MFLTVCFASESFLLDKCSANMGNFSPMKKYLPGAWPAVNEPEFVSLSQLLLLLLLKRRKKKKKERSKTNIFKAH